MLVFGLRPFHLPRELNQIFVSHCVHFISPQAKVTTASEHIASEVHHDLEALSPDSAKMILGDFNQCRFDIVLPKGGSREWVHTSGVVEVFVVSIL